MVKQRTVLAHQSYFGGGGAGIDAQVASAGIGGQVSAFYLILVMAVQEFLVVGLILK